MDEIHCLSIWKECSAFMFNLNSPGKIPIHSIMSSNISVMTLPNLTNFMDISLKSAWKKENK